jgi:hypothetical protein
LAASLDIDSVNAVIDSDRTQIRSIRAELQAKRNKAQNIINIASLLTGGVAGAVTYAVQAEHGEPWRRSKQFQALIPGRDLVVAELPPTPRNQILEPDESNLSQSGVAKVVSIKTAH